MDGIYWYPNRKHHWQRDSWETRVEDKKQNVAKQSEIEELEQYVRFYGVHIEKHIDKVSSEVMDMHKEAGMNIHPWYIE